MKGPKSFQSDQFKEKNERENGRRKKEKRNKGWEWRAKDPIRPFKH